MPQAYVKKLAEKHGISLDAAEEKWAKAKKLAEKQGHGGDYAYVTSIFKKTMHEASLMRVLAGDDFVGPGGVFTEDEVSVLGKRSEDTFFTKGEVKANLRRVTAIAVDSVNLDIPTLIRVLELAREEIPDDAQLHIFVEHLTEVAALNKQLVGMEAYEEAYTSYIEECNRIGLPTKREAPL